MSGTGGPGRKVHFDRDGRPYCGHRTPFAMTGDQEDVTCDFCLRLLAGMNNVGRQISDLRPHGTLAAARRHYRHGDRNLRYTCPACWHAQHYANQDRYARRAA